MRTIQIFIAATLLLATAAHATSKGKGNSSPCSAYEVACKKDPNVTEAKDQKAKDEAMKTCLTVASQTDKRNGKACLALQKKK